jgi:hypothetical protein
MRKMTKRSAIVIGSIVAVVGGTAAFAYASGWFQGDARVGATASSIQNVHIEFQVPNTAEARLWPGREVTLPTQTVTNLNDYPVRITDINVTTLTTDKAGCTQTTAGIDFPSVPTFTLQPGNNTGVALGTIKMSPDADKACSDASLLVDATMVGELTS